MSISSIILSIGYPKNKIYCQNQKNQSQGLLMIFEVLLSSLLLTTGLAQDEKSISQDRDMRCEKEKLLELHLTKACSLADEGHYEDAYNLLKDHHEDQAELQKASFLLLLGRSSEAKAVFQNLENLNEKEAFIYALAVKEEGKQSEVIKAFQRFFELPNLNPELNLKAKIEFGLSLIAFNEDEKAKELFFEVLEKGENKSLKEFSFYLLASLFLEKLDFNNLKRLQTYQTITLKNDLVEKVLNSLDSFIKEEGLCFLKQAIELEKKDNPLLESIKTFYVRLAATFAEKQPLGSFSRKKWLFESRNSLLKNPIITETKLFDLAKSYILEGTKEAFLQAKALLEAPYSFMTENNKQEAALLKALCFEKDFDKISALEKLLLQKPTSLVQAKAWFYIGLTYYQTSFLEELTQNWTSIAQAKTAFKNCLDALLDKKSDPLFFEAATFLATLSIIDSSPGPELFKDQKLPMHLQKKGADLQKIEAYLNSKITLDELLTSSIEGESLLFLGLNLIHKHDFENALKIFSYEHFETNIKPEALYLEAFCAQKLKKPSNKALKELFENYGHHPLSAYAYFYTFSMDEYLMGRKDAIKHLSHFPEKYPNHPLGSIVFYLLGKDTTHERLCQDSRVTKKNLSRSIDYFTLAEENYELHKAALKDKDRSFYENLKFHISLSKALTQKKVALSASGLRKQLYLEYSNDQLFKLLDEAPTLKLNEVLYHLAENHLFQNKLEEAKMGFAKIIKKADEKTQFISKAYWKLAEMSLNENNTEEALSFLEKAERASLLNWLQIEEKLEFFISKSCCLKYMGKLEEAISNLTLAINENSKSKLRLKAMYLRAEIYRLQNRDDLSILQLKALVKQGGEWSEKAKATMEHYYGTVSH